MNYTRAISRDQAIHGVKTKTKAKEKFNTRQESCSPGKNISRKKPMLKQKTFLEKNVRLGRTNHQRRMALQLALD